VTASRRLLSDGNFVHYEDWGTRSVRWAGIRSEHVDVQGIRVHLLRADAGQRDAPVQLLIHPMAAGATLWLDTIAPLTALGPVVAPDLPGAVLGETEAPRRAAVEAGRAAEFLSQLIATLGLRDIVVHGWSFGGLVTVLCAARHPERIARVVLVAPTLPVPLSWGQRLAWRTLGAGLVATVPGAVRLLMTLAGPALIGSKQRRLAQLPPELRQILAEQLEELQSHPERLHGGVTAFASAVRSMYVSSAPVLTAVDRLAMPAMLAWAEDDPFIDKAVIDAAMARRPDWQLRTFTSGGHLLPMECPAAYATTVSRWLSSAPGQ
jgi:pimeloyl-ACP methyl ester carboxylesterase